MGSFLNIEDSDSVLNAGQELTSIGERTAEQAKSLKSRLAEVAATRPWGDDMFGHQYEEQVREIPEGGDTPIIDMFHEALDEAGEGVQKLGDKTTSAMLSYEVTDLLGGQTIAREGEA